MRRRINLKRSNARTELRSSCNSNELRRARSVTRREQQVKGQTFQRFPYRNRAFLRTGRRVLGRSYQYIRLRISEKVGLFRHYDNRKLQEREPSLRGVSDTLHLDTISDRNFKRVNTVLAILVPVGNNDTASGSFAQGHAEIGCSRIIEKKRD